MEICSLLPQKAGGMHGYSVKSCFQLFENAGLRCNLKRRLHTNSEREIRHSKRSADLFNFLKILGRQKLKPPVTV